MARRICQTLFGLAVLYALAIGLFALIRYKGAERPDLMSVVGDFHGWVGTFFRGETRPAPEPGALPAPTPVPSPAPPPAPKADPAPLPDPAVEERLQAIRTVEQDLLPEAEKKMDALGQEGPGFRDRQTDVLAILIKIRNLLDPILAKNPGDRDANRLWDRFTAMQRAASKR